MTTAEQLLGLARAADSLDPIESDISYDSATGDFTWTSGNQGRRAGRKAGTVRRDGYVSIYYSGRRYYGHRLAWKMHYGKWPDNVVDHINGNPSDNRIENLRDVTQAQNTQNSLKTNGSAKYRGVRWSQSSRMWVASLTLNYKCVYMKWFRSKDEAIAARMDAVKRFHDCAPRQATTADHDGTAAGMRQAVTDAAVRVKGVAG